MPDMRLSQDMPVIAPGHDYGTVTNQISDVVLKEPVRRGWLTGLLIALAVTQLLILAVTVLFVKGIGVWGIRIPIGWGWAIINFVWWIGIGHAGTLISAILFLFKQEWRTSINRFAEAMTLFAVACAGIFPILHLGRPWLFFWLTPYPNTMSLWPQWRSPLCWDVFAVSTYGTVSLLFWYVGLIPDLATLRDRAKNVFVARVYGIFALGWRGAANHWHRYETAYKILAGLATPLVLSVHTIVSFDFAVSLLPGWHTTIFPPYFVAGAIYSGFAMVLTLAIPLRKYYKLEDFITDRHLDTMAKVMLATGMIVAYGYFMEAFMCWYSGNQYEGFMILNRMKGPYAFAFWSLISCNVIFPQLLWLPRFRRNVICLFVMSLIINLGMWLERFIIVVTSLHRDFLPSSWDMYHPTKWDILTYVGTIGFFFVAMLIFVRILPAISIFEMRELVHKKKHDGKGGHA
jgi:molybdopterin-containing oxidoreductase family membrane subunit